MGGPREIVSDFHQEIAMQRNRLYCTLALLALVGVTACKSDAGSADNAQVTDTLVTTDSVTQEVQVPVQDTQAVVTSVDTTQDTVDINQTQP
jgi:ABC-type Fe3+-hydroxamate transport system substrate-binding protein